LEKPIPRKKATTKELPWFVPHPVEDRILRLEENARAEEQAFLKTCVQIEQKDRKKARKAKARKAAQERCSNTGEDTTSETETVE